MEIRLMQRLASGAGSIDPKGPLPDLDAQVARFAKAFPGGFDDPRFDREERGAASGRRRATGLVAGRDLLAPVLAAGGPARYAAAHGADALVDVVAKALHATRGKMLRPLQELPLATHLAPGRAADYPAALDALAAGGGDLAARFEAFARCHARPSWPVVTAAPALLAPGAHVLVRPSLVDAEARVLGVDLARRGAVEGAAYARVVAAFEGLRRELVARGLAPRDLADVAGFAWRTLHPRYAAEWKP